LDTDGDGIPDDEDEYPEMPNWGLNLTYLDNTEMNPGEYKVRISSSTDYGVLLVDNTGVAEDTIKLEVVEEPEGWSVSLDKSSVSLDNESIEVVVVTYNAASGASGEEIVVIEGTSENALLPTAYNVSLYCVVDSTNGEVTKTGDKVSVDYTVWNTQGQQLDSGTLPATAGEKYVGPAQNLGYIVGFYMGLIGMEKPGGIIGLLGTGETKQIRVPPQLAYGTDPNAHELGGEILIFELTINSST
jgi:predicted lipase